MEQSENFQKYGGGNAILDSLSEKLRRRLQPHLAVFRQEDALILVSRDDRIDEICFPIDAIYSVIVDLANGNAYEVDLVGRDGFVSAEFALGAKVAARTAMCQEAGQVARLESQLFSDLLLSSDEFRETVLRSARRQWFVSQQTVACNYAHRAEQRAARWILMTQDAVGKSTFGLRPEYVSMMLGLTQAAVLEPLLFLCDLGSIQYENRQITVVSRNALRSQACECYDRQQIPFIMTGRL